MRGDCRIPDMLLERLGSMESSDRMPPRGRTKLATALNDGRPLGMPLKLEFAIALIRRVVGEERLVVGELVSSVSEYEESASSMRGGGCN